MKTRILVVAVLWCGMGGLVLPANAGDVKKDLPMEVQAAKEQVIKHLEKINGAKQAQVNWLEDKSLKEAFPGITLFSVRYRQYPVAFAPPEGLSSSNVFAVTKGGKLETITNPDAAPKFLAQQFMNSKAKVDEKSATAWTKASLILLQELVQDGFYAFEIVQAKGTMVGGMIKTEGKSMVTKGGNGNLQITLLFGADGSLKAGTDYKLIPGPRPKCQATKLLDADPIVRYMAESELLFLGLAARPYLLEQRAKASEPRLQQAIDRLLRKIEAAGW